MAITKIFPVRARLDHLLGYIANTEKTENPRFVELHKTLDYVTDNSKTEQRFFVAGINCSTETAHESMNASFALNDKPLKVLGYHIIQSFAPDEVDATKAHEIGVRLAEQLWGERFQAVVATHLNTGIFHNHIALCSTSFIDGKRYHSCKASYQLIRDTSDEICREYRLSVIDNPEPRKHKTFAEAKAEREGRPTWRSLIKDDIDEAILKAMTDRQFYRNLEILGYEIKIGKDIAVRPSGKECYVRLARNFGNDYTYESIVRRILDNKIPRLPIQKAKPDSPQPKKLPALPKGSIAALYRHYLYLFGYYKNQSNERQCARTHFLLRDDLQKLDSFIEDMRLMEKEGIGTQSQLDAFRHRTSRAVEDLLSERQTLYLASRATAQPETAVDARESIAAINEQLKQLRKQLKQCDRIAERSDIIETKIGQIEKDNVQTSKEQGLSRPARYWNR